MPLIIPSNSISGEFEIANSLRFNRDDAPVLERIPSTSSNQKTFTYSLWVKRSKLTADQGLVGARVGSTLNFQLEFDVSDTILSKIEIGGVNYFLTTNALYRDPSAWYHIVYAVDTTQATASNRVKLYVNNSQVTSFSTEQYPPQNGDTSVNTGTQYVGAVTTAVNLGGYMAEVCLIDGSQLDPTSFGEFDEDSGIWKPINVSGLTFGTNGFYLDFESSGTTASLGLDKSGNGNDFTVYNLNTIDQTTDTPTNNFATLNALNSTGNGTEPTYSEGNLQSVSPSSGGGFVGSSTIGVSTGKWFFEVQRSSGTSTNVYIGIGDEKQTREIARQSASAVFIGNAVYYKPDDGNKVVVTNGSGVESSYGDTYGNGDIIGIALNMDDNEVTFYKNGTAQDSGTAISIPTPDGACFLNIINGADTSDTFKINFGSPPFTISSGNSDGNGYGNFEYAVPSGYYALNTKNLAEFG